MSRKIPMTPPDIESLFNELSPSRLISILTTSGTASDTSEYHHWDKLFHIPPPGGLTTKEWWMVIKIGRQKLFKSVPLTDKEGKHFQFLVTDKILEELYKIDLSAGGRIGVPAEILNPETRNQYFVSSLIEEAITSSQLEGATTTREVAKQMIRDNRPPADRSERMILNNYLAMQRGLVNKCVNSFRGFNFRLLV
jgi:hypothetical protein